jgi:hypothetical protein
LWEAKAHPGENYVRDNPCGLDGDPAFADVEDYTSIAAIQGEVGEGAQRNARMGTAVRSIDSAIETSLVFEHGNPFPGWGLGIIIATGVEKVQEKGVAPNSQRFSVILPIAPFVSI